MSLLNHPTASPWGRSRHRHLALALTAAAAACLAASVGTLAQTAAQRSAQSPVLTDVERDTGDALRQGLQSISRAAAAFVQAHVARAHDAPGQNGALDTAWRSLEPDLRIMVGRCAVPLQARWTRETPDVIGADHGVYHVQVSCPQTVSGWHGEPRWEVDVPTTRPITRLTTEPTTDLVFKTSKERVGDTLILAP